MFYFEYRSDIIENSTFCSPVSTSATADGSGDEDDNVEKSDNDQAEKSEDEAAPPPEAEIDLRTYFRLLTKSFCSPGKCQILPPRHSSYRRSAG